MSDLPIRSTLLLLSMLSLLGLQYSVFLPIFASEVLHRGAKGFGLLMSAAGVGAVLGALHFAARTSYKGLARWIAATSTLCAVGLVIFSQSRFFWLSMAVLLVVGFCATVQMAATNTTLQNRVPDQLRGRIMAVYATMFMGVQPIGSLIAGGVAKHIGAPYTLGGVWNALFFGEHDFYFSRGHAFAAAAGSASHCLGWIWAVEPVRVWSPLSGGGSGRGKPRPYRVDLRNSGWRRPWGAAGIVSRRDRWRWRRQREEGLGSGSRRNLVRGGHRFCRVLASRLRRGIFGKLRILPRFPATLDPLHYRTTGQE